MFGVTIARVHGQIDPCCFLILLSRVIKQANGVSRACIRFTQVSEELSLDLVWEALVMPH